MELGIFSFGDMPAKGGITQHQRMKDLVDEVELADQVGLDVFAIGEHHRPDFLVSAPVILLAAGAAKTKRIKLSSSVTVLSSEDPVRVFQQFSTLDLISDGRAEIMAGRGSFIESFPLFGLDLNDYEELFVENLDLLLEIRAKEVVTWNRGRHRAPIDSRGVYPRPLQEKLPIWIAVGGTPQSVVRAGTLGLPLAIAILGGDPARFEPFAQLHRRTAQAHGYGTLPLGINMHGFIAQTTQGAKELFWPGHEQAMNQIGRERGWPPQTRAAFEQECSLTGAIAVGSPEDVIAKIQRLYDIFKMDRFMVQLSVGHLPHKDMMQAIELYGNVVAPAVREYVAQSKLATASK